MTDTKDAETTLFEGAAPAETAAAADVSPDPSMSEGPNLSEDAALAQLDGGPDPQEQPAAKEPAAEKAPPAAETETTETEAAPPPAIAEARQTLARGQVPQSVIDKMDDVELLSYAHKVDTERRERERIYQASKADKATAGDGEASGPAEAPDSPSIPLDVVSPLAEQLGLDDEGAQVLADTLAKIQATAEKKATEVVSEQSQANAMESSRRELQERLPVLKDPESDAFKAVVRAGQQLEAGGASFKTPTEFWQAAVDAHNAPAVLAEARKAREDLQRLRDQGQVTTQTRAATAKPPTQEERYDSVLDILESTDPQRLEKARGVAGG